MLNTRQKREHLRELIEEKCLTISKPGEKFTLSTGEKSDFYFDCKKITLDGEGLALICDLMLDEIQHLQPTPTAIGGLTMGADFIVAGVITQAFRTQKATVFGSIIRQDRKEHGTRNKIENKLPPGVPTVVIDDVVTTGKSTIHACDELSKAGYRIIGIAALVDREESNGKQNIEANYPDAKVICLFRASEFHKLREHREFANAAVG